MNSRREFVTGSLAVAGAALLPRHAAAAPKSMTVVHESSFIKPFDDFFVKTLAPEYEKLTRLTMMAETKAGPEITATGLNWAHLFDGSLVDLSDVAAEIGKKLGGWHE